MLENGVEQSRKCEGFKRVRIDSDEDLECQKIGRKRGYSLVFSGNT
jgi:hypothetical protein